MDGSARDIMDREAYRRVKNYFLNDFLTKNDEQRMLPVLYEEDFMEKAFKAMIRPEVMKNYRESFSSEFKTVYGCHAQKRYGNANTRSY